MRIVRLALAPAVILAAGALLVSGGAGSDPRTPPALPGSPPPFLGTSVSGDGGLTAAVDAYGDVVDLRAGPAGAALIENPAARQAAGTVPAGTGIVPRIAFGDGPGLPLWRAESVTQRYLPGTNVVRSVARVEGARLIVLAAATGDSLAMKLTPRSGGKGRPRAAVSVHTESGVDCIREGRAGALDLLCRVGRSSASSAGERSGDVFRECERAIGGAVAAGRRWSRRSRDLGAGAPAWARELYRRSLLSIHALTSRSAGAAAAGARDGWAYVWPRDAASAALALAASGHRAEARHVARFLTGLDLGAAARFDEGGAPVPGRAAQGDVAGWVDAAAAAVGIRGPSRLSWRGRADYQESSPGSYLGNALAAADAPARPPNVDGPKTQASLEFSAHQHGRAAELPRIMREFGTDRGLVRRAGDPGSGLDSAAGWAVRPFGLTKLYPAAERTLLRLARRATPYGITPGEGWEGGDDPWTAPTAWSAWALAGLAAEAEALRADRRGSRTNLPAVRERGTPSGRPPQELRRSALALLADLRRAATPAGDLPERVDVRTGVPTSTTPLLWSSALTVLALRELWP